MSEINTDAPVVGSSELEIAATPEVAWDVLTEIEDWPSWNPEIKSVSMDGGPDEGAGRLQKTLDRTLRGGLAHLKTEAERRGRTA